MADRLSRRGILKLAAGSAAAALLAACGGGSSATNTPAGAKPGTTALAGGTGGQTPARGRRYGRSNARARRDECARRDHRSGQRSGSGNQARRFRSRAERGIVHDDCEHRGAPAAPARHAEPQREGERPATGRRRSTIPTLPSAKYHDQWLPSLKTTLPNVTVKEEQYAYNDMLDKLRVSSRAGQAPDTIVVPILWGAGIRAIRAPSPRSTSRTSATRRTSSGRARSSRSP